MCWYWFVAGFLGGALAGMALLVFLTAAQIAGLQAANSGLKNVMQELIDGGIDLNTLRAAADDGSWLAMQMGGER